MPGATAARARQAGGARRGARASARGARLAEVGPLLHLEALGGCALDRLGADVGPVGAEHGAPALDKRLVHGAARLRGAARGLRAVWRAWAAAGASRVARGRGGADLLVAAAVDLLEEAVESFLPLQLVLGDVVCDLIPVLGLPPLGLARRIVISLTLDFLGCCVRD